LSRHVAAAVSVTIDAAVGVNAVFAARYSSKLLAAAARGLRPVPVVIGNLKLDPQ